MNIPRGVRIGRHGPMVNSIARRRARNSGEASLPAVLLSSSEGATTDKLLLSGDAAPGALLLSEA